MSRIPHTKLEKNKRLREKVHPMHMTNNIQNTGKAPAYDEMKTSSRETREQFPGEMKTADGHVGRCSHSQNPQCWTLNKY